MSKNVSIVLFRNTDLRIIDNLTLKEAVSKSVGGFLLPIYIWDKRFNGPIDTHSSTISNNGYTWNFKFDRISDKRKNFLISSLLDVKSSLKNRFGSDLVVINPKENSVADTLKEFLKSNEIENFRIYLGSDVPCYEEYQLEKELRKDTFFFKRTKMIFNNHTMLKFEDLPFSSIQELPDSYSVFRSAVEQAGRIKERGFPFSLVKSHVSISSMAPLPFISTTTNSQFSVIESDDLNQLQMSLNVNSPSSAIPFNGGETEAVNRLSYYIESGKLSSYKKTRNGLLGLDYSSKLSPYLSFGCIGPRFIISQISEMIKDGDEGAYWLWFELLWRDYFYIVAKKYKEKIFSPYGLVSSSGSKWNRTELGKNDPLFKAWSLGQTGVPFVDANMRELALTGYMSNRGRQNVASFLVKDLGLDWRLGAEWFESLLVDHDPCLNYCNWLYVAGLGNDPRQEDGKDGRYFNVVKQGRDYDPNADYILTFVPELYNHSNPHAPWIIQTRSKQKDYPSKPIVIGKGWDRYYTSGNPSGKKGKRL